MSAFAKHKGIGQLAETIIHNYLEDLGQGSMDLFLKTKTVKEVLKARDKILTLSPKPGCSFSGKRRLYSTRYTNTEDGKRFHPDIK